MAAEKKTIEKMKAIERDEPVMSYNEYKKMKTPEKKDKTFLDDLSTNLYEPSSQRSHEERIIAFENRGGINTAEAHFQFNNALDIIKFIDYKPQRGEENASNWLYKK